MKKPRNWTLSEYYRSYYQRNKHQYRQRYEDNKERKTREQEVPKDYYIAMYRSYGAARPTSESPNGARSH